MDIVYLKKDDMIKLFKILDFLWEHSSLGLLPKEITFINKLRRECDYNV